MKISEQFPSRFLKAVDLGGATKTVTIKSCTVETLPDGKSKPALWFSECEQGLILNVVNSNMIAADYGDDTDAWVGRVIQLRSEGTTFQGRPVQAIRVATTAAAGTSAEVSAHVAKVNNVPQGGYRQAIMSAFAEAGVSPERQRDIVADYIRQWEADGFDGLTEDQQVSLLRGIQTGAYDATKEQQATPW